MILGFIDEAVAAGARREQACAVLGLTERTLQRWRVAGGGDDGRAGPRARPANALTAAERARVLEVVNAPEYRDLSPKQIVPRLADEGRYVASESTIYRILRAENQDAHRGRAKPRTTRHVDEHVATAPNQVWSWDITYLLSAVRGRFFYLYLIVDVWSRCIVGFEVHEDESVDGREEPRKCGRDGYSRELEERAVKTTAPFGSRRGPREMFRCEGSVSVRCGSSSA